MNYLTKHKVTWVKKALGACLALLLCGILWAALPATEAFTNTDGTALTTHSASWTLRNGNFAINTNAVYPNDAVNYGMAYWNADTFSNNQYAQFTLVAAASGGAIGVATRMAAGANTAYGYIKDSGTSDRAFFKRVAGTFTEFGYAASGTAVNDVFRLEANGTTIRPIRNGSTDTGVGGAVTDSAIASGAAGLVSNTTTVTTTRGDNWEAGNLPAPFSPGAINNPIILMLIRSVQIQTVHAQSTSRLYLMPLITTGDQRRAKYRNTHMAGLSWSLMDFGNEPLALVSIRNIPPATHALLEAEPDVLALPQNLDQQIGAQVAAVQNALESRNLPAGWVQATHTYRQVVRTAAQAFQFAQRLGTHTPTRLFSGATLDTQFNQLPVAARTALANAAGSLGYSASTLSGTSTLRAMLKAMADEWRQGTLLIGGEPL
jgi:hypothetical protein